LLQKFWQLIFFYFGAAKSARASTTVKVGGQIRPARGSATSSAG